MNYKYWIKVRGPRFILQRGINLLCRYGVRNKKAIDRINNCVSILADLGCKPTFPIPAIIVEQNHQYIRHLQDSGAEIAVHSYQHIHLNKIPVGDAIQQLMRAVQIFENFGIEAHGFRCPYLGCTDEIIGTLPKGLFDYSSNEAIQWDIELTGNSIRGRLMYETINSFYSPRPARSSVCVPRKLPHIVEIPVCVPDDLLLHDGLNLDLERIAQAWCQVLLQTYQRGELFNLMFHPELADACEAPFTAMLHEVKNFHPHVWIARLMDISNWWKEKASFKIEISQTSTGLQLSFLCSPRATILVRGLDPHGLGTLWDDGYYFLETKALGIPANPRPFIGIASNVPTSTITFLAEQGYILDTGETARLCGIYLDSSKLSKLTNEVDLVNHIESNPGPLVRYWRWPDGAKSALCVTGDLDALTLLNYASRLFTR